MYGILIDKTTGLVIDKNVIIEQCEPKETEEVISYEYSLGNPVGKMNKPKRVGDGWIDTEPFPTQPEVPSESSKMEALIAENKKLWDSIEFLLKETGYIPVNNV